MDVDRFVRPSAAAAGPRPCRPAELARAGAAALAVVLATFGAGQPAGAQQQQERAPAAVRLTGHPLVGSWALTATFEGQQQPPLTVANLVTFTSDGTMVTAIPPRLPGQTGSPPPAQDLLRSTGHGAWTPAAGAGGDAAEVRFAYFVTDAQGNLAGIATVRGSIRLEGGGDAFAGSFVLDAADPAGRVTASSRGTVRATRIAVGSTAPVGMPATGAR